MEEIISLNNISFSYDNSSEILYNLNLVINKGDFIGVVGENGSGKSTLLKLLLGVVKPTSGEISFSKKIKFGYVNQTTSTEEGAFPATVYEVVSIGLNKKPFHFLNKNDKKRIDETLELFNLTNLKSKSINSLSGGQMQKVKIAKVLISNPDIIILDEPTTGIDCGSSMVLLELINHLHAMRKTIIFVSHKKEELKYCNRIIKLKPEGIEEVDVNGSF